MSVKILAFDLDYTLIDSKKRIPQENIEALRYAASKGVYIVPATGRIYIGIPEELRTLPFMRWYLTANGSYIYDAVEDRAAARAEIPLDQALDFYACADSLGLLYDCYLDNWGNSRLFCGKREWKCRSCSSTFPISLCAQGFSTSCRSVFRSWPFPPPCPSTLRSMRPTPPRAARC